MIKDITKGFVLFAKKFEADSVPVGICGFDGYAKKLFEKLLQLYPHGCILVLTNNTPHTEETNMTKEIKMIVKFNDENRKDCIESYITDSEIEFVKVDGWDAIRFIPNGKKRGTRLIIEKMNHWKSFEVVITEATTGRRLYTFN